MATERQIGNLSRPPAKYRYGLLFVLTASILLSLCYSPYYNVIVGDKEIYRYIGRLMWRGGVPYRDVFDHKPPLIYFLNFAGLLMGSWGQWLIDTLLALLATFLFFRINVAYRLSIPWLLPLLFNLMIRQFLICLGMGMTREYTAMLMLIFFCILMGKQPYRFFLLGLIGGLIFFMQQDQVLALLPFFVYAFFQEKDPLPVSGRVLRAAMGSLCVALPLLIYFAWNHALSAFWQDAFAFNFTWYTSAIKESFWDHFRKIKTLLDGGNYEMPFMIAITLGIGALLFPNRNRWLVFLALLAVPLSIIPEFLGGRDPVPQVNAYNFSHYVLPLAAALPILLFCVFAFSGERVLQGYKPQALFGFLLCTSLAYTALQHGTHLTPAGGSDIPAMPEGIYLRDHKVKDYQLYIFGSSDALYICNKLDIVEQGPWIYHHFWNLYNRWDTGHAQLNGICRDLIGHNTAYVLDFSGSPGWFLDPSADRLWHGFLRENYEPVMVDNREEAVLWKRKGTP